MRICSSLLLAMVCVLASVSVAAELTLEIFVSEPDEINVTSPLIMGRTEMMVVCAQGTKSAATRLADVIEAKGLHLKYIYLTHAHLDHSQGAGVLLERFPDAQFIAHPDVARLQVLRMEADDELARSRYGDNAAVPSVPVAQYSESTLVIDGEVVEIWTDIVGDAGLGHPFEPHTALYVPSLRALIPSDVVYYHGHVMMGGSSAESRSAWIEQLQSWRDMDLQIVVPGHMPKIKLDELTAAGALDHTLGYIKTYDRVIAEQSSSDAVIEAMLAEYPDIDHQSALYLGTYINFRETHRLMFNPTIEKIAALLPDSLVKWIDNWLFESRQASANLH